jgi:hypothetical protein
MIEKGKITTILNSYKRPYTLDEQIQSIKNQTIKSDSIQVWHNESGEEFKGVNAKEVVSVVSSHNFKFHGRFALALLAKTEYIALFDDDTMPGPRWFESCLNCMKIQEGIYGTTGCIVASPNAYMPHQKVGWNGQRVNGIVEVDLVGHAWFFKREWLRYLWGEEPVSWDNGEDMQFSAFCQMKGGIRTFVPPHPPNDMSVWGSKHDTGMKYGNDKNAASGPAKTHIEQRNQVVRDLAKLGWKLVRQK